MAIRFVDNGASATEDPYDTWDKAAVTLAIAITGASTNLAAGDDIHMAADHTETPSGPTYAFPGTAAAPNRVISVTQGTTTYNKADNIQVDTSGTTDMTITGLVKFYGISFKVGDDIFTESSPQNILFDDSTIELDRSNGQWVTGTATGQNILRFKNSTVNFSGGGTAANFQLASNSKFYWDGGLLSHGGTMPTALFDGMDRDIIISMAGVDLLSLSTTTALVDVSDAADIIAEFHHCVKDPDLTLTTGTIASTGTRVLWSGVDDTTGNDLYNFEYVDYYGSIVHDDAIFVTTGGASDGTTPISWKMVTTANATEFSEPLISPPIVVWVDGTGSKTFTVQCLWDSVTDIQNDEIWLEVEYLEASADTDSAFANDGLADILATPADQATNSTAWTESLTNDNEFAIAVTATVNRVGPAICRVHMGKPSTTVYVDPKVTVT